MIRVKYPIVVEGKYDKMKLSSLVEATIITANGFGVFHDREKLELIRRLATVDKVILLTDSDRAGFRIRGYLAGAIPADRLVQLYIPEIYGKERRKAAPSAEGTVGVEGVPSDILLKTFADAGVLAGAEFPLPAPITKQQLYALGLSGGQDSAALRRRLQCRLKLPSKLSANGLCTVLPRLVTFDELCRLTDELRQQP
ncbi:MAG: DUF4093 domain-containing protein [Angelakisella sp.]